MIDKIGSSIEFKMYINVQSHNLLFFHLNHGQDIEPLPLNAFLSVLRFNCTNEGFKFL